jgi:hypothetical protein
MNLQIIKPAFTQKQATLKRGSFASRVSGQKQIALYQT